jgi:AraC family transcriptional regulator, arabinose operon regulatory protein
MDLSTLIPRQFLNQPHAVTRYLYMGRKPGRLTCLFQRHVRGGLGPLHLEAFPSALEADNEFKKREDARVYAVSYVLSGAGRLRVAGESPVHLLKPGTVFQYNGQTMRELELAPDDGFTECSFSVDGATGDNLARLEIWDAAIRVAHVGMRETLVRSYKELYDSILNRQITARSLLHRCIDLLDQVYSSVDQDNVDSQFRSRACGVIAGNPGPAFTMREAAESLGMAYDVFRRRFKKFVGVSPIEYQLHCRIEQACTLLHQHSVKETADLLDYSDPFVFSRQFKKITGSSPRQYQRGTGWG